MFFFSQNRRWSFFHLTTTQIEAYAIFLCLVSKVSELLNCLSSYSNDKDACRESWDYLGYECILRTCGVVYFLFAFIEFNLKTFVFLVFLLPVTSMLSHPLLFPVNYKLTILRCFCFLDSCSILDATININLKVVYFFLVQYSSTYYIMKYNGKDLYNARTCAKR